MNSELTRDFNPPVEGRRWLTRFGLAALTREVLCAFSAVWLGTFSWADTDIERFDIKSNSEPVGGRQAAYLPSNEHSH
jgi:hypothetical protein